MASKSKSRTGPKAQTAKKTDAEMVDERISLAREIAYQLEPIFDTLVDLSRVPARTDDGYSHSVRLALALRGADLVGALLQCVGAESARGGEEGLNEAHDVVNGLVVR